MINKKFWNGKNVLVTGHTGFKGTWLCIWLTKLGANVTGYALDPPTVPSLYCITQVEKNLHSIIGDVRDRETLTNTIATVQPEIVFHLAAQPLVRTSYSEPVVTYETNVMGTVNLLEAIRKMASVHTVVNVTTDKCYENKEWLWGYRENEPLGGQDPYSSSKACSELITTCYRNAFFSTTSTAVASARAGNVIGGGDWSQDRLIPDCLAALWTGQQVRVRNPRSIRPWQHVLEALAGYLVLAEKLWENGGRYAEAWNFGPDDGDAKEVLWIVEWLCERWPDSRGYFLDATDEEAHEANYLRLDSSKARTKLGWYPVWSLNMALEKILEWALWYEDKVDPLHICSKQLEQWMKDSSSVHSDR